MKSIRLVIATVLVGSLLAIGCGQIEHQGNCGGGYLLCDFECADPITDPLNCGSCGLVCEEDESCSMGICQVVTGNGSSEPEVVLADYDREYLPTIGYPRTRKTDEPESCGEDVREGRVRCGGTCVNTLTDRSHCGGCFNACLAGMFCRSGECTPECPAGLTNCGGMCVNLYTVRLHCGACYHSCAAGHVCTEGECVLSCETGLTDCGGSCVNLRFDRENCGGCGDYCASGDACINGGCTFECPGDQVNCGGVCADLMTDPLHCGLCNHGCDADEICVFGTCELY